MTTIKITSETADVLADFLSEYQPELKNKLITEGYEPEQISEIVSALLSMQGNLINMLGEQSGTSFTVEIK
jgi:hypothetical protein